MCLSKVLVPTKEESDGYFGFGYKIFVKDLRKGFVKDFNSGKITLPIGEWCTSRKDEPVYNNEAADLIYEVGYHIFPSIEELKKYRPHLILERGEVIYKVKYQNILAVGYEAGNWLEKEREHEKILVIIAKNMFIMNRVF